PAIARHVAWLAEKTPADHFPFECVVAAGRGAGAVPLEQGTPHIAPQISPAAVAKEDDAGRARQPLWKEAAVIAVHHPAISKNGLVMKPLKFLRRAPHPVGVRQ